MKKTLLYIGLDVQKKLLTWLLQTAVPSVPSDLTVKLKTLTEEDGAMRDLVRCRDDIKRLERKVRQRLLAFLLRHGITYHGQNWTNSHSNWLASIKLDHPAQQIVL